MHCDSQVVVGHITGDYEAKGEQMKKYLNLVKRKIGDGFVVKFVQISREENKQADRLAKATSAEYTDTASKVLSFIQYTPAIDELKVQVISLGTDWTMPVISYLKDGTLPEDLNSSRRLKIQAACFVMIRDVLCKRGLSHPYLRCLALDEADCVMREKHEGICGNHSWACSLVHKLVWLDIIGSLCIRTPNPM